jgi:hypothetical protein
MAAAHFQFLYEVQGEQVSVRAYVGPEGGPNTQAGTMLMAKRDWWELAEILMSAWPKRVDFVRLEPAKAEVANG